METNTQAFFISLQGKHFVLFRKKYQFHLAPVFFFFFKTTHLLPWCLFFSLHYSSHSSLCTFISPALLFPLLACSLPWSSSLFTLAAPLLVTNMDANIDDLDTPPHTPPPPLFCRKIDTARSTFFLASDSAFFAHQWFLLLLQDCWTDIPVLRA